MLGGSDNGGRVTSTQTSQPVPHNAVHTISDPIDVDQDPEPCQKLPSVSEAPFKFTETSNGSGPSLSNYATALSKMGFKPGMQLKADVALGNRRALWENVTVLPPNEVCNLGYLERAESQQAVVVRFKDSTGQDTITLVSREASRFIFEAYYTYRDTLKPFKLLDNDNVTATLEGRSHRGKVIPPLDLNGAELERLLAAGQVAIELKRDQRRVFVPLDSGHITRIPDPLPKDRPGHAKNGLKSTLGRLQPMSDSSDNDGNEDVQNFKRRRFDAEDHGVDMDIPVKGKEPDSLFIADKPDNKLGLLAPLYSSPGLKRFLDQVDHDMLADAIQESVRQKTWDLERKFKSQAAEVNELRDDARTLRLENARLKASSVGMSSRSPSPLARQSSRDQFSPFEGDDSSESHVGPSSSTLRKTAPLKKKEPEKRNVRPESEHRGLAVVIPEAINRNFSAGTDEARDYAAHWKARKGPLEKLVKRWNERHGNFVSKINGTEESAKYKVHPVYEEAVVGLVLGKLAEHVRKAKTASESTQPVDTAPVQTFKEEQQVKQDQKVKEEPIEIIDDDDDNMEEVARQLAAHEARLETPHNGSAADQGEPTKACPICTYENPLTFLMCDVCGSEIP